MSETEKYLKLIEDNWDDIGACGSCGWHAMFYEHNIDEYDVEDALKENGNMQVYCISKDDEDSIDHRGARFNILELEPTQQPETSEGEK